MALLICKDDRIAPATTDGKEKGGHTMSEIEKKMAETIKEGLPKLSEFDKGYFYRALEEAANRDEKKEKEGKDDD